MAFFSRRLGLAAVLAAGVGVAAIAAIAAMAPMIERRDRPAQRVEHETALTSPGAIRPSPSANHATPLPELAAAPVLAPGSIEIEVDGVTTGSIDGAALAERPTTLQARDRRAWRLPELLHNTHIHSMAVIHAVTNDGGDYILFENGRQGGDAIVVRRNTGELYIGWLDGDATGKPLADAERPAERIENLVRIAITAPVAAPAPPPASLAVVVDGRPRQPVTAQSFPALARLEIQGQREGTATAIDIAHAFGGTLRLAGLTAGGARVRSAPPSPDARAVIYLTRRARFKFAWVDAAGEPIRGTKQREVSELVLETTGQVAARR